jgi:hypothetical protein
VGHITSAHRGAVVGIATLEEFDVTEIFFTTCSDQYMSHTLRIL